MAQAQRGALLPRRRGTLLGRGSALLAPSTNVLSWSLPALDCDARLGFIELKMRVLGIDIASTTLRWVGLDGVKATGAVFLLSTNSLELPQTHANEAENYQELRGLISTNLQPLQLDAVAVVRAAAAGRAASPSVERVKCELVVQFACLDLGIPCHLVHAATISAAAKRGVARTTGSDLNTAFNGGAPISPAYLDRAAHCAWTVLA